MKIRQKTLLLISIILAGLITVLYASLSTILLGSFKELEQRNTRRDVQRVLEAFEAEVNQLSQVTRDYAAWDDTYVFIEDRNEAFVQANLVPTIFDNLKINLLLLVNKTGTTVFAKGYDLEAGESVAIPSSLQEALSPESVLLTHPNPDSRAKGILLMPEGAVIIASQPIVTSEREGPVRGSLLMGRNLDMKRLQQLEQQTQLSLEAFRLDSPQLTPKLELIGSRLEEIANETEEPVQDPILTEILNQNIIAGYTVLNDIYGQPALLLQVNVPREIYHQGQKALRYLIISLLAVSIVFGVAIMLLLERVVLSRLTTLSHDVKEIGNRYDLSMRVKVKGRDELTTLAKTINWMLENLDKVAKELAIERQKAEDLLLNILPEPIATQLKDSQDAIAENFDEVTILFADIVGFTPLSARLQPIELVNLLNEIFSKFDRFADQLNLEKIKTIGDAYMVAAGLPVPQENHAEAIAEMAIRMQEAVKQFQEEKGEEIQIRVGINTGVVVAGVIGTKKFIYDLWGDAVNIASRMESSGEPGMIQMTEATYIRLKDKFILKKRGKVTVKGKGEMETYWLLGRK
ncbi:MAG: adenylate/guanylate cyclase domain-containing protein [Chroococcales cyanobacterium]